MNSKYTVAFEKRMTREEKKIFVAELISTGDKRSYNEIMADLELKLWKERWS